jgi:hypothetical protein
MGGNFALFAAKHIKKKEELTHSYISPHQLLGNAAKRASHLFFQCQCSRCSKEDVSLRATLATLEFHRDFSATQLGIAVGHFKVALALGSDKGIDSVLTAGQRAVGEMQKVGWSAYERPLATLDVVIPFIDLFFTALASQDPAATNMFPSFSSSTSSSLDAASNRFSLRAAAVYLHEACGAVLELSNRGILPVGPSRLLHATSNLQRYLIGAGLRKEVIPSLRIALSTFQAFFSLDALREDMSCLGVWPALCSPSLDKILKGEGYCPGLEDDECGGCRSKKSLALCEGCKACKFCSKECLKRHWRSHKHSCHAKKAHARATTGSQCETNETGVKCDTKKYENAIGAASRNMVTTSVSTYDVQWPRKCTEDETTTLVLPDESEQKNHSTHHSICSSNVVGDAKSPQPLVWHTAALALQLV